MNMELLQQQEPKIPGAHKIGAAISGPRIAGGKITDVRLFLRAACQQNETAPVKLLNRYEERFEKRGKRSEERSETRPKNG